MRVERWRRVETGLVIGFLVAAAALTAAGLVSPAPVSDREDVLIEARAHCMPNQGWAPLPVCFSPFGSRAPDGGGELVRYEWDLDGDGAFETDATASAGYAQRVYTKAGIYPVSLRVTDARGHTRTAGLTLTVRHPASSSVDYWTVFDDSRVRRIDLLVSRENWNLMHADPGAKVEVEADAVVFGRRLERVGLSMRGNFSLLNANEKKPWQIDTDAYIPGQEYQNLRQLLLANNLGDPSLMGEKLIYDLLEFAGVPASQVCFVEVWVEVIDDAPQPPAFLGVYSLVERVDMKFIANRLGRDSTGGNLYKANHFLRGAADLVYYGDSIEDYASPTTQGLYRYGLVSNEGRADYSDLINLCRVIDGEEYESPEAFAEALEQVFNVDGFLRYMAVQMAVMTWDFYPNTGNNFYLYHDPATGRFEWFPWDQTWGGNISAPLFSMPREGLRLVERAPLFDRVFEVPRYRETYAAYLDLLIRERFNRDYLGAEARRWHDLVAPHLRQGNGDPMYFGPTAMSSLEAFDTEWQRLVELVEERSVFIRQALDQPNGGG